MRRVRLSPAVWIEPWDYFKTLDAPQAVLLESARTGRTGRYSIAASDPFLTFRYRAGQAEIRRAGSQPRRLRTGDPFGLLKTLVEAYRIEPGPGQGPFAAGAIGVIGYECKDYLEPRLSSRGRGDLSVPEMFFQFYDRSVVWDHQERRRTFCRMDGTPEAPLPPPASAARAMPAGPSTGRDLRFSMSQAQYEEKVRRLQGFIRAGDIFQANLSHRIDFEMPVRAEGVYEALRRLNPSPFFGLFKAPDFQIISGSPERLLSLSGRHLETRPIAGTRRRGQDWRQDAALSTELLLSEKERAEHVMLVDLERNDLGRVCEYGSVHVDELMALEDYSHVKHIVSNVCGRLRGDLDGFDALKAFFPGGTITGTPKIRCMQILDELETVPRGPYTGSLGYFSFTGDMDFNILIRSLVVQEGRASLNVGAGIVADSDPTSEYHETLYKAEAVLQAVFGERGVRDAFRGLGVAPRAS